MLNTEPSRAYYGMAHVEKANEALAIETLLVKFTFHFGIEIFERSLSYLNNFLALDFR